MPIKYSYLATHLASEFSCPLWSSLNFYTGFLQQGDTQSSPISWPSTLYNFSTGKHWELLSWQVPELWLSLLTFGFWNHMILLHRIPTNFFFSWSPGEENTIWVDQMLLLCCSFMVLHYLDMLVFCMVLLNTNCNSRFINREWVTHHQNATTFFSGGLFWVFFFFWSHIIQRKELQTNISWSFTRNCSAFLSLLWGGVGGSSILLGFQKRNNTTVVYCSITHIMGKSLS